MQNPIAWLFRPVVEWFRLFPHDPSRSRLSRAEPRDKGVDIARNMDPSPQPTPSLSPAQFRRMLHETLAADPDNARQILKPLIGSVIPIVGGSPTTNYICKFDSGGSPTDTGTPVFEKDGNKIGIGTTSPAVRLHVFVGSSGQSTLIGNTTFLLESNSAQYVSILAPYTVEAGIVFGENSPGNYVDHFITAQYNVGLRFGTAGNEKMRIATNGNVGIGETNPQANLHIQAGGEGLYIESAAGEGRLGFLQNGETSARNVIYRDTSDFTVLRNFNTGVYTILKIWAPPNAVSNNREATLALVRGDNDEEFIDLYNNGYSTETQYGIRIQKRGTGSYRDFVFDKYSGSGSKVKLLVIATEDGNVGIGDKATPGAKLDVNGGNIYVSSAGNGIIFKSPDGSICKKLTIDNSGNPVWTTVTCP